MLKDQVSALEKEVSRLRAKNRKLREQLEKYNEEQYARIVSNVEKYPALIIEFPFNTSHQKEAIKLAAAQLKWHPQYVFEFCCAKRPSLFHDKYSDPHWEEKAIEWQKEHDLSVEDLANYYADFFDKKCAYRVYEPIEWFDGVRISAFDFDKDRMPCLVSDWN